MIVKYTELIFRKIFNVRCAVAFVIGLPLLFLLSPEAACARIPATHATSSVRFLSPAPYPRWQARAYAPHRYARMAPRPRYLAAMRPRHGFAAAWPHRAQRRLMTFAAARPAMRPERLVSSSSVVADALRFVGAGNVTGMRGPWCADYASMILRRTGHRPLAGRSVSAAFAYGPRVRQPRPGDLVVINTRAGYAQHVGFFAGWSHGQMEMVSGNWGHRVSVSPISPGIVAAFIGI